MRKPGTDESNVQMSDVLCDFCGREWSEDVPMIEGHRGSCLCANCLTLAYTAVVVNAENSAPDDYKCPMCLEAGADREALARGGEPGWQSPLCAASICRRCIELAAESLGKDKDFGWERPE